MRFLRNQGDPWMFLLFIDRGAFVFPVVAALYFRLPQRSPWLFGVFGSAVASLLVYSTPHRYGLCVALDYLTRARWGGLKQDFPPAPSQGN